MLIQTYIQQQLQKLQGHRHHHHDTEAMAESGSDDDDEELTRDEFNLNKLIVLVTGAGKVIEFNLNQLTALLKGSRQVYMNLKKRGCLPGFCI